jgi:hypothetical protein
LYSSLFQAFQGRPIDQVVHKGADGIIAFGQMESLRAQVNVIKVEMVRGVKGGVCSRRCGKEFAIVGPRAEHRYFHFLGLSLIDPIGKDRVAVSRGGFWMWAPEDLSSESRREGDRRRRKQ